MISKKIEKALNEQIAREAYASYLYLAMASWCDREGYEGMAKFLYRHSEEERDHMLRLFNYINDAGGHALAPEIKKPKADFKGPQRIFEEILEHEIEVTKAINDLVDICLKEKDYSTFNFLQWYVAEQHEEEKVFMNILDRFKIVGTDGKGLYWMDTEIGNLSSKVQ